MRGLIKKLKIASIGLLAVVFLMPAGMASADPMYTITGTFYDGSNNPIIGADLFFSTDVSQDYYTTTDSNGDYSIELPPGEYAGGMYNMVYDTIDAPKAVNISYNWAASIDITASNAVQDFYLDVVEVTVTVKDNSGNPIQGYQTSGISTGPTTFTGGSAETNNQTSSSSAVTDSNGQVVVKALKGTTYHACAISTGSFRQCGSDVVTSSSTPSVEVQFPQMSNFSGTLKGAGGQAVTGSNCGNVHLSNNGLYGDMSLHTNSAGNFSVDVPPDVYGIDSISYSDCTTFGADKAPNLVSLESAGWNAADDHYVDLSSGNVSRDLVFDIATVTITVKDALGDPMPNVAARPVSTGDGTTTFLDGASAPYTAYGTGAVADFKVTDSNGEAEVLVLKGLEYWVCAITTEQVCNPVPIAPTGDMNAEVQLP
jgi:hypothetical protein